MQVVGAEDEVTPGRREKIEKRKEKSDGRGLTSREDIRRKLASWGEEEEEEEEEEEHEGENNNLEICFINETASDDEDVMRNPLDEEEEDEEEEAEEKLGMSRSKSEGSFLRGGGEEIKR